MSVIRIVRHIKIIILNCNYEIIFSVYSIVTMNQRTLKNIIFNKRLIKNILYHLNHNFDVFAPLKVEFIIESISIA